MRLLPILLALLTTTGCGSLAPLYVKCKGKGVITATGALQMGMLYGAGGVNTGTLQADCGEGFEYSRTPKTDETPQPTKGTNP